MALATQVKDKKSLLWSSQCAEIFIEAFGNTVPR